jgi:hypothetical protein
MGNTKISNIIYPEEFKTNYIYAYVTYQDELKDIIQQSGRIDEITKKYRNSLTFLSSLRTNCFKQRKLFEKLKKCKNIYSIKLHGEINLRVLFTFMKHGGKDIAILLYPFIEKDSKDYEEAKIIASNRIKTISES